MAEEEEIGTGTEAKMPYLAVNGLMAKYARESESRRASPPRLHVVLALSFDQYVKADSPMASFPRPALEC